MNETIKGGEEIIALLTRKDGSRRVIKNSSLNFWNKLRRVIWKRDR